MLKVLLFGAVKGSRAALPILHHPEITLTVVGLDPARASRHADYHDLAAEARGLGLNAHEVTNINDAATLAMLRQEEPDVVCVFGWSQLVGDAFRSIPRIGVLGWHPSLLPTNRGRAVIPWTILQRTEWTGFTVFWIDEGMDSGDIAGQERIRVDERETAASLYTKLEAPARRVLVRVRDELLAGRIPRTAQHHAHATYCALRTPEDGLVDWTCTAEDVDCLIRAAGPPYAGAFSFYRGQRITILDAMPVDGARYWGIAGQVQWLDELGATVRCGGGTHLLVRRVRSVAGLDVHASALFKMHERLGQRPIDGGSQR